MVEVIDPEPPPCHEPECPYPGRFVLGITDGAQQHWCFMHVDKGMAYFRELTRGVRAIVMLRDAPDEDDEGMGG